MMRSITSESRPAGSLRVEYFLPSDLKRYRGPGAQILVIF